MKKTIKKQLVGGRAGSALAKMARVLLLAAVLGGVSTSMTASAQNKPEVKIALVAEKVSVAKNGKEIRQPAGRVLPGDTIRYEAGYSNQGAGGVRNLVPTLPIPPGTEFIAGSAQPAPAQASLDGKKFAALPLVRPVAQADGTVKNEPVPVAEYRALRWPAQELAAGKATSVSARVRVTPVAPGLAAKLMSP